MTHREREHSADWQHALNDAYGQASPTGERAWVPAWAYALPATVPFVGNEYPVSGRPRLLIYASAEHIGTAKKDIAPWLAEGYPGATDRHQIAWRGGWPNVEAGKRIGIAPYEDGPLMAAAMLLWRWLLKDGRTDAHPPSHPVEFTEQIAVANLSKFARPPKGRHEINEDVRDVMQIRASLPYVRADLKVLRPDLVLIAKSLPTAEAVELTQVVAQSGAQVVYTLQGSGQGPSHAITHLRALGGDIGFDLCAELGGEAHAELLAFPGRRKDLHAPSVSAWFALLRARYEATKPQ